MVKVTAFGNRGGKLAKTCAAKRFEQLKAKMKPIPEKWPKECVVDDRWCSYLPPDWTPACKKTENGLLLQCMIGPPPERKRFFHKKALEAYLGRQLTSEERGPKHRVVRQECESEFPPKSFLKRTAVQSLCDYLNARCNKAHGLTIEEAIGSLVFEKKGVLVHYNVADLRYDIAGGRLEIVKQPPTGRVPMLEKPATVAQTKDLSTRKRRRSCAEERAQTSMQRSRLDPDRATPYGSAESSTLASIYQQLFKPFKRRAVKGTKDEEGLYTLLGVGHAHAFESTVLAALPAVLRKDPSDRGALDALVLKQFDGDILKAMCSKRRS